jgi:dTDP-4-dehydrorhamnose 3,5-epimerase
MTRIDVVTLFPGMFPGVLDESMLRVAQERKAVDIRVGSPTFGKWVGVVLSAENFRQLYIPPGFVHGFCVLSEHVEVEYKCTDFYTPGDEMTVAWNDPALAIAWPVREPILSKKDAAAPRLAEVMALLPVYDAAALSR